MYDKGFLEYTIQYWKNKAENDSWRADEFLKKAEFYKKELEKIGGKGN